MKIASRYLLPVELITAVGMVTWGFSGWIGGAGLWKMLERYGQNTEWGVVLCGVGFAQLAAAGSELWLGRYWKQCAMRWSVSLRFWLAFFAVVVWLYACYAVLTMPDAPSLFSLTMQAPVALACSVWIVYGNRKVACILDPSVPTIGLQRQIMEERHRAAAMHEDAAASFRGPH